MSAATLESGYWQAYRDFYRWGSILRGAAAHEQLRDNLRHLAYAGGWKKFEPLWDWIIRLRRIGNFRPFLEVLLAGGGQPFELSRVKETNSVIQSDRGAR